MTLATWSKILGILGGALTGLTAAIPSTTWKTVIGSLGAATISISVVIASSTSAGHPDGSTTTQVQSAPILPDKKV